MQQEQKRLEAALAFCNSIREQELEELDVDRCLEEIQTQEKQGNVFANILKDYKKVVESEKVRAFTFWPDDFCTTPRQMTDELFRYANENNLDIVITKEGMTHRRYAILRGIAIALIPMAIYLVAMFLSVLQDAKDVKEVIGLVALFGLLLLALIAVILGRKIMRDYAYKQKDDTPWFFY